MIIKRRVYTTGQVSEICNVSVQTAIRWCDKDGLNHFVIPGSKHRRVSHTSLLIFMRNHNIQLPVELIDDRSH